MSVALVTKELLKASVQRILGMLDGFVSKDSNASLETVDLPNHARISSTTETLEDESEIPVIEMTVDDDADTATTNLNVYGKIASRDGIQPYILHDTAGKYYTLPNDGSYPASLGLETANDGGTVLTTKYRQYEVISKTVTSSSSDSTVVCHPNMYNVLDVNGINGDKFTISLKTSGINNRCDEYLIELDLRSLHQSDFTASQQLIDFFQQTPQSESPGGAVSSNNIVLWANGAPVWYSLIGRIVLVHIVNRIATWSSVIPDFPSNQESEGGGSVIPSPTQGNLDGVVGAGTLLEADNYRLNHSNQLFQWVLKQPVGDITIRKPIWHIGEGIFIDALGSVIEYSNTNQEVQT